MKLVESVDLYIKYLVYEKNLSLNSINSYKKDIKQFIDFLVKDSKTEKKATVKELNLLSFRKFLKYVDTFKYSNNTIIRKYASLMNYFKFLENNNILKETLSQHIMPPKKHKRLYSFLSQNEIKKMLGCIDISDFKGVRDKTVIEFIYSTGARVSEVENLKINDVDISKSEATVFGKGRKYRTVYLNSETAYWLKEYFKKRIDFIQSLASKSSKIINEGNFPMEESVFLNCFGKKLTARSIRNIVIKYAKQSNIGKKIGPHGIRHTFATHLLQEGAGIREIQELLGHEDISTTQIYTHLNIKKIKEDYKRYHPRAK